MQPFTRTRAILHSSGSNWDPAPNCTTKGSERQEDGTSSASRNNDVEAHNSDDKDQHHTYHQHRRHPELALRVNTTFIIEHMSVVITHINREMEGIPSQCGCTPLLSKHPPMLTPKHSHSWQNHCSSTLFQTAVMSTRAGHLTATVKGCPKCP